MFTFAVATVDGKWLDATMPRLVLNCEFAVPASGFKVQGRVGLGVDADDRSIRICGS